MYATRSLVGFWARSTAGNGSAAAPPTPAVTAVLMNVRRLPLIAHLLCVVTTFVGSEAAHRAWNPGGPQQLSAIRPAPASLPGARPRGGWSLARCGGTPQRLTLGDCRIQGVAPFAVSHQKLVEYTFVRST